jgi:signal transduction histidine kinase
MWFSTFSLPLNNGWSSWMKTNKGIPFRNSDVLPVESKKSKIRCLRVSFIGSMIVAAAICGSISFVTIQNLELDLAEQTYYSIATSALKGSNAATRRKIQACQLLASIISYRFPNASQWPFVALPGFYEASKLLLELSTSPIFLNVRISPQEVNDFEFFASQVYQEQGFPDNAGVSDFGFGVWRHSQTSPYADGRVHDTTGNTTFDSKYSSSLWPSLLSTDSTSSNLLFNAHSEESRGSAIDNINFCSLTAAASTLNETSNRNVSSTISPSCGAVTGFLELLFRPGPAAILYQPIYPVNDPTTLVGLTGTSLPWEDVLIDVVPDSVDGLYCIISTETESHTFIMKRGVPSLLGYGDFHDPAYDKYGKSVVITAIDNAAAESPTYTLTVYPSGQMFENKTSWYIAFGFVMVIVICTFIFLGYDFLMRNQSRQNKVILEVKRRFVRFISHEIRTPLNTVCLGLELLQSELNGRIGTSSSTGNGSSRNEAAERAVEQWSSKATPHSSLWGLVDDILENANNAVGILNDLLNYDKMEQGTFKLELGTVSIWELVHRTVVAFDIQAKKRAILLDTRIDHDERTVPDLVCLQVLGDDVRLRQVIRNVISNSLKFCPENTGTVHVTMQHSPHGLPNAVLPRADLVKTSMSNNLACEYPRAGAIRILVQDNGVGMTEDQLHRLFQEGVQFEPNTLQVSSL